MLIDMVWRDGTEVQPGHGEDEQGGDQASSSGRNALRGRQNKFGELGQSDGASKRVGENHKLAVQGGAGLASIAKVNVDPIHL